MSGTDLAYGATRLTHLNLRANQYEVYEDCGLLFDFAVPRDYGMHDSGTNLRYQVEAAGMRPRRPCPVLTERLLLPGAEAVQGAENIGPQPERYRPNRRKVPPSPLRTSYAMSGTELAACGTRAVARALKGRNELTYLDLRRNVIGLRAAEEECGLLAFDFALCRPTLALPNARY
eukprot:1888850-Rhodomonas_salina.3